MSRVKDRTMLFWYDPAPVALSPLADSHLVSVQPGISTEKAFHHLTPSCYFCCTGCSWVLPEHLFPAELQRWWNRDEPALLKDLGITEALHALAPLPSTLSPFSSQLAIRCTLAPSQNLNQSLQSWYLPFWTHFSSPISKATVFLSWAIPHLEDLMVVAFFAS